MVGFQPKKKRTVQQGFSLDRREQLAAPVIKRREGIRLLIFLGATALFVVMLVEALIGDKAADSEALVSSDVAIGEDEIVAMAVPDLAAAVPLPSMSELEHMAEAAAYLQQHPAQLTLDLRPLDALTLAWARQQLADDRQTPPIPQGYSAEDIVLDRVAYGRCMLLSGVLVDAVTRVIPDSE